MDKLRIAMDKQKKKEKKTQNLVGIKSSIASSASTSLNLAFISHINRSKHVVISVVFFLLRRCMCMFLDLELIQFVCCISKCIPLRTWYSCCFRLVSFGFMFLYKRKKDMQFHLQTMLTCSLACTYANKSEVQINRSCVLICAMKMK